MMRAGTAALAIGIKENDFEILPTCFQGTMLVEPHTKAQAPKTSRSTSEGLFTLECYGAVDVNERKQL